MYNLLNGTEHCMYSNCQSYIHVHVLKFCLTDQSLSKNGGREIFHGREKGEILYHCRQRKVQLVSFKNYPYPQQRAIGKSTGRGQEGRGWSQV